MTNSIVNIIAIIVLLNISQVLGHGMVMDPVNRLSAWRLGFNTPINYDDNANYCGGRAIQHEVNKGKCGVCGDNYKQPQPRNSENGGFFGTGTIVKNYTEGQEFTATVKLTKNHLGWFEFALCPLKDANDIETEKCFENNPILTVDGERRYKLDSSRDGDYKIKLILPKGLTCESCSFRWHWTTANNWGVCPDGTGQLGCGPQETFRTCSDIAILTS